MRKRASGIVLIAALALAGCAAETAPDTSATPTASATPTPAEKAEAVAFPAACEDFLPAATIGETLDETWIDGGEPRDPADVLPGPTARAAAAEAAETLSCRWVPDPAYGGYALGFAMQIEAGARNDLVAAFGVSGAYEPILLDGADIAFATSELRGDLRHTTVYAFVGELWVAFESPMLSDLLLTIAGSAVSNIAA